MYAAVVSFTFAFSTDSSRLDAEADACTLPPTLRLNFSWATLTFFHTACCDCSRLAASLRSFVAIMLSELLNSPDASLPRLLQRPDSTQNAAIGMRPDLGGTMKSTEIIRSDRKS